MHVRRRILDFARIALASCVIGLAGAPAAARAVPVEARRERVLGDARKVALGIEVQSTFIVDGTDRAAVLEGVRRDLEAAGLTVVSLDETARAMREVRKAAQDYEDPATGKFSVARYEAGMGEVLRTLRERTAAERLFVVVLSATEARVTGGVARWYGVEEPAVTPAARSAWSRLRAGTLDALTLTVNVRGDAGKLLYSESGGVRLLSRFGRNDKVTPVLDADLLSETDRNARAVRLALAPLLGAVPTALVEGAP